MADTSIPISLTSAGRTNTPPSTLLAQVIALAQTLSPGLTASLPGLLIEDLASTATGAVVQSDQAVTEAINSLTPYAANAFTLYQLGQIYGTALGQTVNTSVYVVFTGTIGFVIPAGFIVSDGTNQYVIQDGGAIAASGSSAQLYAVSTTSGSFGVPVGSVTQLVTSVPTTISLSVTNPVTGVPSTGGETEASYRARTLKAGLAAATGFPSFLTTLLGQVPGVQTRLINVIQQSPGWLVICGGGDPYAVAYAIFCALFDISNLQPSVTTITGITNANPGVVTTAINHGFTTGQTGVAISGVTGMTGANGTGYTVTVLTPTTFSFGVNTTGFGSYVSGGVVTPNTRNISVNLIDYPDTYTIQFVNPPQQTVSMTVTWNTISPNTVAPASIAQAAQPAIVAYINSITVGQPINVFELQATFQAATANIIPNALLTRLVFSVSINGVGVSPTSGTGIIAGDPQSYFQTNVGLITVNQG